ncbi:MAG: SDR family oxidoreductase [Pseudomonadota bacterium]
MTEKRTALITGASAGIGKELAILHAIRGGDLVLVARREAELNALKADLEQRFGVSVMVIVADLTEASAPQTIYDTLQASSTRIDYLINNAGLGANGLFHERPIQDNLTIVDVNIAALMRLTHLFSNDMVKRGFGRILQVGSTAGMLPGPLHATYHASKAFVNSFSFALDEELRAFGVTSTVLAPGPVQTEFFKVADMENTKGVRTFADPVDVARQGYEAMERGDLICVNDPKLRLLTGWIIPLLPRRTILKMARSFATKV